jgi:hypothetical protein
MDRVSLLAGGFSVGSGHAGQLRPWSMGDSSPGEAHDLGKWEPSYCRYDIIFHLQCCANVDGPVSTEKIECESFDELSLAVDTVPEGQLMALSASNVYDCSGHYSEGGICNDTTAEQFNDSFDLLGVFADRDLLLMRAKSEIKKAAAHVANFKHTHGYLPTVSPQLSLRSVREQMHGIDPGA